MKKLIGSILFVAALIVSGSVVGQNTQYPTGISFKALAMDYQSQNDGSFSRFKDYHQGFEIAYSRNIQDRLNLVIPFKLGIVNDDKYEISKLDQGRTLHKGVYGLDAQIQYQFFSPEKQIVPFVLAGLGFVNETDGGKFNMQAPLGAGIQIKAAPNAYISLHGEYRIGFTEERTNLQYGLGFVYLMGKGMAPKKEEPKIMDSDGDGVADNVDLCPQIAGLAEMSGCPDGDGDGIADYQDKCPDRAGLESLGGCPDFDGDGIADDEDKCPDQPGTVANGGCPNTDRDNDGVSDVQTNLVVLLPMDALIEMVTVSLTKMINVHLRTGLPCIMAVPIQMVTVSMMEEIDVQIQRDLYLPMDVQKYLLPIEKRSK